MPFFDPIRIGASGTTAATGFTVDRSLRFNDDDSAKLTRTFGTNTSNTTKTISFWVKRARLTSHQSIFTTTSSGLTEGRLDFTSTDELQYTDRDDAGGGSSDIQKITRKKFRDLGAWYNIVLAINTADSTADDRVKIYVNGVQETDFSGGTNTNPSSSYAVSFFRSSVDNFIGANNTSSFFDGYLAEINFIDGQALTPSSFGETDSTTGQWIPIDTSGLTFGNNGFRMKFADNSGTSATTLGKDSSGNSNNFTPSNFSVSAGSGNDSLEDTPTNNFATLNNLDLGTSNETLANGNLDFSSSGAGGARSTIGMSSGKYYAEVTFGNDTGTVGITKEGTAISSFLGNSAGEYSYGQNGNKINGDDGSQTGYGDTFTTGDTISVAFDADGGNLFFYKNGALQASGTAAFTGLTDGPYFFAFGNNVATSTCSYNFGQRAFAYTIPTGYKALNSANLPDPSILLPNSYFDILLWTANASTQAITGLNFSPDWVWGKSRDDAYDHEVYDTVRGTLKRLKPNANDEELTNSGNLTSFDSGGFTLGSATNMNFNSGSDIVGWCWEGGTSTVTNSDGTISSQVRASATAGFSIVTYTGNGTGGATVGHGLGVAPQVIFVKRRNAADDWRVNIGAVLGSGKDGHSVKLNSTGGENDANNLFNSTNASSTVFTIGTDADVNGNTSTYVAYCFSEVEGYSKFGMYTGNGDADGTFIFTSFRPSFFMNKATSFSKGWRMTDSKRSPSNPIFKSLFPELDQGEYTATGSHEQGQDFLSNGIKIRNTNTRDNQSGSTYFFMAFAEAPLKYARAR